MLSRRLAPLALLALWAFSAPHTRAQSITPAPDGTGTVVQHQGNVYHIDGGTQAAANLFHSFQAFGLSVGEIVNFLATPDLQNILSRVTGGEPSIINGLIQISGGTPNLYLLNPAGIVFGSQARLNVPADFTATTADRIGLDNHTWFNASGANDYANLSGRPNQFAFLSREPAAIVNAGELAVRVEQDLSLYGGTIVNAGNLQAPGGQIVLAAVPGENLVRISQPGMLLSLDIPAEALAAGFEPADLSTLLTGAGLAATAAEPGRAVNFGSVQAQAVHVAAEQIGEPGQIRTHDGAYSAPTVTIFGRADEPLALTFLDITVPDYETLLYGGRAGTTAIAITPAESGMARITETLAAAEQPVAEVQIVAEGNAGNFWLGRDFVAAATLDQYREQLASWSDELSPDADLLLYSCFTALGEVGETFIAALADLTRADVAASTNATGSAALGGDWTLEASTGSIEADLAFEPQALESYAGRLATITVTNDLDAATLAALSGDGGISLREAIEAANTDSSVDGSVAGIGADDIRFAPGVTLINLVDELAINEALTIDGNGTNVTIQGDGTPFRIFNVTAGAPTTFNFLTITGGNTTGNGGGINSDGTVTLNNSTVSGNSANSLGGGIYSSAAVTLDQSTVSGNSTGFQGGGVFSSGVTTLDSSTVSGNTAGVYGGGILSSNTVTLNNSTISSNLAGLGGGILSTSTVTLNNSTISGNSANADGGGIRSGGGGTIRNSTLTNNVADADANGTGDGGGIFVQLGGAFAVENSIIAENRDLGGEAPDLSGDFTSSFDSNLLGSSGGATLPAGFNTDNLVGVDPGLFPLGDYGGPTQTHALRPDSPALNAGDNASAVGIADQRGAARISEGTVDVGAYESAGFGLAAVDSLTLSTDTLPTTFDVSVQVVETAFSTALPIAGIRVSYGLLGDARGVFSNGTSILTDAQGRALNFFTLQSGSTFEIVASTADFSNLTFTGALTGLGAGLGTAGTEIGGPPEPFTRPEPQGIDGEPAGMECIAVEDEDEEQREARSPADRDRLAECRPEDADTDED